MGMDSRKSGIVALVAGLAGLGAVGPAAATTVYDWTGGGADITGITVDGSSILSSTADLALASSSTATLDSPTAPTQLSFAINEASGDPGIALSGTVTFTGSGGKTNTLNFGAATFTLVGVTFDSYNPPSNSLALSGSAGSYTFNSGTSNGVAISGNWSLTGATDTVGSTTTAINVASTAFGPNYQPISGTLGVTGGGETLTMNGVPLGTFTIDGQTVAMTGNIILDATAVPLPSPWWLLGSAFGLFGLFPARGRISR